MLQLFAKKDAKTIELFSPLSIEECIKKINQCVNSKEYYWLRGKADKKKIKLYVHPDIQNSFIPVFYGSMFQNESGITTICGKFALHKFTRIFFLIWFISLSCFLAFLLFLVTRNEVSFSDLYFFPFMYAGAIIMIIVGCAVSKKQKKYVLEFMQNELMVFEKVIN